MTNQKGRAVHGQAAHAREDDKHLEALKLYDEAILAYQEDKDILGLAEVFADRSIVYRHLYDETNDKNFLIIAKYEMLASVEMVEEGRNKEATVLPYFNLAKVYESLGQLNEAKEFYQKTVNGMTNNPPSMHNRPAVLADMKIHLATCEYKTGDKSALDRALQALADLEIADEVKYNKDVWLSGGHMKIAEVIRADNTEKAEDHLQKAKEIIDSNPDLKLRKAQWENLAASFN